MAQPQNHPLRTLSEQDATATWSLKTLQRALRQKGLPRLGASTIGEVLHEHGVSFQQMRHFS